MIFLFFVFFFVSRWKNRTLHIFSYFDGLEDFFRKVALDLGKSSNQVLGLLLLFFPGPLGPRGGLIEIPGLVPLGSQGGAHGGPWATHGSPGGAHGSPRAHPRSYGGAHGSPRAPPGPPGGPMGPQGPSPGPPGGPMGPWVPKGSPRVINGSACQSLSMYHI